MDSIKEKLTGCSNERKIQMLTLSLEDWAIQKIVEFFSISEYAVKQARKLKKRKRDFNNPFQLYAIEKD